MNCSMPGLPVHHQLLEFTQSHVHRVSDAFQPSSSVILFSSWPQSLPASESFPMSQLCMTWPKYWSFSFSIIPSKEDPGLIFRMDQLDLLAVQGTLKSLLQHHSSKASILQCSAFFTVELLYPYITTGKTTALTRWKFVDSYAALLHRKSQTRIRSSINGLAPSSLQIGVLWWVMGWLPFCLHPVPGWRALCTWPWSQRIGWRSLRDSGGGLPGRMLRNQLSNANQGSCDADISFCMGRTLT